MPTTESADRPPRRGTRAWLWPTIKGVLIVAVVAAVGWQFARVLRQPDLWARPLSLHPGWLAAAAALYLAGLLFPAIYWRLLLRAWASGRGPWRRCGPTTSANSPVMCRARWSAWRCAPGC